MQSPFINNNISELLGYLEYIKADYHKWQGYSADISDVVRDNMFDQFCEGLSYKVGKKYCKVMTRGSVHSFIVLEDGPKFKAGDILKAASWAAPATNFARANLLGDYSNAVRWTGAQ